MRRSPSIQSLIQAEGGETMEITEVRLTLRHEERLKAFVSITFDNAFVVRGLKVIDGNTGLFVAMPSRRRKDGEFRDIAHPINNATRQMIEDAVLAEYQRQLGLSEDERQQEYELVHADEMLD
jgi:stage V sporulation protein G